MKKNPAKSRATPARREDPVVREVRAARAAVWREAGGDIATLRAQAAAFTESLGIKRATDLKPQKLKRVRRRAS
jgi:hypothetical protein